MSARDITDDSVAQLRVPPHSVEAEQSVLGALLQDGRAWGRIADVLTEADFYRHEHRRIFGAIGAVAAAGKPVDVITVFEELQSQGKAKDCGGLSELNALALSVPSAANLRTYAKAVRDRSTQRRLIGAASDMSTIAWGDRPIDEKLDQMSTLLGDLQRGQMRSVPRTIADIAVERTRHYEDLERGTATAGWPTHIPALDAMLNGGLRAGGLYILAARPSVGKSSIAQQLGQHQARDGRPTLFCSMEMSANEVADRGVTSAGRVSYSALLTGKMGHEDWERATEGLERLSKLPLFVDDQAALSMRDLRAKSKSIKGLKVLIVDYLQLMSGSARRDSNRNAEIEEISRGLKALAKDLGIAVIALSQLNREVEKRGDKRPNLSDLRDSGAIEQDADVVMFLWPVRGLPAEGRRIVGLDVAKNRQGRTGEVGLDFYGDIQRWGESTADIRPPARGARGDDL